MKRLRYICLTMLFIMLVLHFNAWAEELYVGKEKGYSSLTAAVAAATPGDVIHVSPGIYAEPFEIYPIEINRPITLIGEPGAVLKGSPLKALLRVNSPDVSIRGLEFHLLRYGIVNTGDRLSLLDCRFVLSDAAYRVSSSGVWLAGVSNCTIATCDFFGCGVCIAGPPLSEQSQGQPVLTGLFEVGEDPAFFTSHTLRDNRVNGKPLYYFANEANRIVPMDAGGVIAACCENIEVAGIDVSDNSIGIQLAYCSNAQVIGVTADRCGVFGIYLAHNHDGRVKNIVCRECNHGIDIRATQNMFVTGCTTSSCEQGIFLSFATDCIVDDCSLLYCGVGFFIAGGARNQLSGSWVEGNENGIYIQGEKDMLVCGNVISGNSVAGLRFLRSSGQVIDNSFRGNQVGVLAVEANPLTLWNNAFSTSSSAGLYLRDITSGKISFNTFDSAGKAAMELDGTLFDTLILENLFRGGRNHIVNRSDGRVALDMNNWEE